MTTAADGERALGGRGARDDRETLDAVVDQHAPRLYRLVPGITRSAYDAEAVVGEVLVALVGGRDAVDPAVPLRSWLARTATRAALGRGDPEPAALATPGSWLPTYLPDGHRAGNQVFVTADWSGLPEGRLLDGGGREIVDDTLGALTARDRAILLLADVEGLPPEEIGAAVGAHPAAVRDRLHHVHMVLRERLTHALVPPRPR